MKLPPSNLLIPPRGIRLRGYLYSTVTDGRLVIRHWPRAQPSTGSPRADQNRQLLADASTASLYMDSHQVMFSRELSKRTLLAPRDLLMMALFKRLGVIILKNGRKIFSVAARQDVSSILDAIGQVKGNIMFRGDSFWQFLQIGAEDQVLSVSPAGVPYWRNSGGGGPGGGHQYFSADAILWGYESSLVSSEYWIGTPVIVSQDTVITGIRNIYQAVVGGVTAYAALYEGASDGKLQGGTLKRYGNPVAVVGGALTTLPLSAPYTLHANTPYYIGAVTFGGNYRCALGSGRNNVFFPCTTDPPPSTAPAESVQFNTNWPAWGY